MGRGGDADARFASVLGISMVEVYRESERLSHRCYGYGVELVLEFGAAYAGG